MVHRWMRKWLSRLALRNERGYDKGSEQRGVPVRQRHVRLFVEMLEDRNLLSVHIQFDFSHDFNNFFSANPQAQTTLQAAADQLTSSITTSLSAISPGGTNTWTAITFEPSNTAQQLQISNLNVPADTLIVFAGGENLSAGSSELGQGGPGGFNAQGSSAFLSTVSTRGQTGAAATPPTGFGPWGGSITFATNPSGGWYLGTDPTQISGKNDFYSVALHELGHLLGIGTAGSWKTFVSAGTFVGTRAVASFGGAVPLDPSNAHWAQSDLSQGLQPALTPTLLQGTRKNFTALDFAGLADIGWQTQASSTTTITGLMPASGLIGSQVVIVGTNFINVSAVAFNGTAATSFTVNSPTQITATVPAGASTGLVSVAASAGTATSPTNFTVTAFKTSFATGAAGQFPTGIVVGDFNGDGKNDAAVANYGPTGGNTVSVIFGTGNGTLSSPSTTITLPAGTNPFGITTGKFIDGSNNLAIVTGNFSGQSVAVIQGNGDGTFKTPVILPAMDSAGGLHKIVQVTVGDLNGDNHQDIVAASGDGTYTVFLGNGNGTFNALFTKSALTPIFGVSIATINTGSGPKPSLVAAAFAAWKVAVLPGNGDGTFAAPIFSNQVGGQTDEFLGTGDFNGDGKTDVAVSNKDSANMSVLLGNGNGTFSSITTFAVGSTPLGIAVGDINKDGVLDVATANLGANSVSILLGNGNGTFAAAQTISPGPFPLGIGIGDFKQGEGAADIVVTNFFGNQKDTVTVAYNNTLAPPVISSFSPGSGPVGSQVVILGLNFFNISAVSFNGVATTNFTVNAQGTQITVFVPTGASTGLIGVTNGGGIGVSATPFTVT